MLGRPTWAEISLGALRRNFRALQDSVSSSVAVCAVVKANAYGHGGVECARALEEEGAAWLGVTNVEEGAELRRAGIEARILTMTGFYPGEEQDLIRHRLTPAISDIRSLELLETALRESRGLFRVHVEIDTGMARLGIPISDLRQLAETLHRCPHLELEGVFTHLASSEILDGAANRVQRDRFRRARQTLHEFGFAPHYLHIANSAALIGRPEAWENFVRPGIALFGECLPLRTQSGEGPPVPSLERVLSWKTRIIGLRTVEAGEAIGYGGAYRTPHRAQIAVLPVGYADGYRRQLSSRAAVLVKGRRVPVVGNVSMDLTLVDVTRIPDVQVGQEAILIGQDRNERVTASELAALANTIPYEILCGVSGRVKRLFVP